MYAQQPVKWLEHELRGLCCRRKTPDTFQNTGPARRHEAARPGGIQRGGDVAAHALNSAACKAGSLREASSILVFGHAQGLASQRLGIKRLAQALKPLDRWRLTAVLGEVIFHAKPKEA